MERSGLSNLSFGLLFVQREPLTESGLTARALVDDRLSNHEN